MITIYFRYLQVINGFIWPKRSFKSEKKGDNKPSVCFVAATENVI